MKGSLGGARAVSALIAVLALTATVLGCAGDDGDADGQGIGAAATAGSGEGPSGQFSVLTYDVGGLPQEFARTVRPGESMQLISPMLNDYDVVLTQDDYDWYVPSIHNLDVINYHARLRSQVTHQFRSDSYPGPTTAGVRSDQRPTLQMGDGLGILSRFPFVSRHPLDDVVRAGWPDCHGSFDAEDEGGGDCVVARGFAMVTLTLDTDVEIDVYTMQAEVGSTPEDRELRTRNFEQLASYIEQHSAGHAVVLAGATSLDMAGGESETWTSFLERTGLRDTCEALSCDTPDNPDKIAFRDGDGVVLTPAVLEMPRNRFVDPEGRDLSYRPPVAAQFQWQVAG
ncbi:MAG TPA: hypothetical protein VIL48_15865 [Acidimicrobiales bacterium]